MSKKPESKLVLRTATKFRTSPLENTITEATKCKVIERPQNSNGGVKKRLLKRELSEK